MNVFDGIKGLKKAPHGAVMSIGNFDGLHLGHAHILKTMRSLRDASKDQHMVVVTFEPHPLTVLRPEFAPPRLTPPALKRQLLEEAGVDDYVVLPPTRDVLGLSAEEFWRILRDDVRVAHLVEGNTFNFGKDRRGTIARLREWSAGTSVQLQVIDPVSVALLDLHVAPVSSSLIRWLLENGRVRDAAICLGKPYVFEGRVVKGYQRGRKIGVPTINLDCGDQLLPADGVYAGRCILNGETHTAAVSIGNAPTFENTDWQIEAHLLDFDGDLYGQKVQLEITDWLREQQKFTSIDALKEQITRDIEECRKRASMDASRDWDACLMIGDARVGNPCYKARMTDDYQRIIDTLKTCKRVLVTTHVRPDGDALGSSAAMVMGMKKVGIEAEVLLLSHLPTKYSFIFKDHGIPHFDVEKGWPDSFDLNRFDALLVVDTGTWSQLPGLKEHVERWNKPKLVVDHHLTQESWADAKLVITEAAAAGEIVAELLQTWGIELDRAIATALYVAIASDTGWFQFSNTRPFTMRLAATLMEAGVDTDQLYQHLYQNERPQRVLLQTKAMQSLELLADGKLAVMTIHKQDFADTGAHVPDTENLINIPLQIRSVEVSLLFIEPPDAGPIRVSLRSKGSVDVAKFAEQFGGGGHARAAGLKLSQSLDRSRELLVSQMSSLFT